MGYPWFLGAVEEGSAIFLSITGCLPVAGMEGLPWLLTCRVRVEVVVKTFILDIGSN